MVEDSKLFAALLKYWRHHRGLSQLDLALGAEVSARHISFLETGRSSPSPDMVLLLAATMDLPLRERNAMMRAAGFAPFYEEPREDALSHAPIARALEQMMSQHEPFPMLIMDRHYNVLRFNQAAARMFDFLGLETAQPFNAIVSLFDPKGLRPHLVDWEEGAREMAARIHQESLCKPHDQGLQALMAQIFAFEGVPASWRKPDFSRGHAAALVFRVEIQGMALAFLTTLMRFNAPHNITLDELQIESYFPHDDVTDKLCRALAASSP